jgi:lactate 2-monooxygenase
MSLTDPPLRPHSPARQFGDFQLDIYFGGLEGRFPAYPVDFASLERKAGEVLPWWVHSYVAGGCGDEHTQRMNVSAFGHWGIVPRMLNGAYERDLSVSLLGMDLPSPLLMSPIGVIGICSQDFHGDLQVAEAAAMTGVPMIASTLTMDPMEDVAARFGSTPGLFQLYTPRDRDLAASFVHRAEQAGFKARHVDDGLAAARPEWRELPAAARLLPGELLQRRHVPAAAERLAAG